MGRSWKLWWLISVCMYVCMSLTSTLQCRSSLQLYLHSAEGAAIRYRASNISVAWDRHLLSWVTLLADRTTVALMLVLRLSVVCNVCMVAKRCVLAQKLLLTVYRTDRGFSPLAYWWSFENKAWFQRTTNRPVASRMVTWPMTSRDPKTSNWWPQYV